MIVEHPDKNRTFVMQAGTPLVATVETCIHGCVQIGHFGGDGLLVDDDEWNAFIELVVEADRVKRAAKLQQPRQVIEAAYSMY